MGYTHYFYREKDIDLEVMKKISSDLKKVLPEIDKGGIILAGGDGSGSPVINNNEIIFNGLENCGHKQEELGITWPSDTAGGLANTWQENPKNGKWFAGALLEKRACGGNCSHETLYFPRMLPIKNYHSKDDSGKYFEFCKTAFKPYDIAVTAFFIIAKYHLKTEIDVRSDGNDKDWFDAKMLCQSVLGYGFEFNINGTGSLIAD